MCAFIIFVIENSPFSCFLFMFLMAIVVGLTLCTDSMIAKLIGLQLSFVLFMGTSLLVYYAWLQTKDPGPQVFGAILGGFFGALMACLICCSIFPEKMK